MVSTAVAAGSTRREPSTRPTRDSRSGAAAFTAAVAVTGKGRVGVLYYSLRNDPARNNWVDSYLAVSANRGRSFRPSKRVSTRAFPASDAAQSRGFFLGDYQGLVAGRAVFRPLFVATMARSQRQPGRYQADVFTASVKQ